MICVKIEKNKYVDSLETLFTTGVLNDQKGIEIGYVNMANKAMKEGVIPKLPSIMPSLL